MSLLASATACLLTLPTFACVNTSYSLSDEREITNDLRLLVIGAFPHHGPAFYEKEVERCEQILEKDAENFAARNDLGAAFTKLGRFDEGESEFLRNNELHPGRYRTASNLGVLYKKWGKFELSAEWLERALSIRPGGHMGLGDYYLKMVRWREQFENVTEPPTNFLGIRYDDGADATSLVARKRYIVTLIKNDMAFADAYFVLGDISFVEEDYSTAIRCYLRGQDLGNKSATCTQRIHDVLEERPELFDGHYDFGNGSPAPESILREFAAARAWLAEYRALEARRLAESKSVDFASMSPIAAAMIDSPVITERTFETYSTHYSEPGWQSTLQLVLLGLAVLIVIRLIAMGVQQMINRVRRLRFQHAEC